MGNCSGSPTAQGSQQHEARLIEAIDGRTYRVVFEPNPFGKGACRVAFKGVYEGLGYKGGTSCVTKVFVERAAREYKNYHPDLQASRKAEELARQFNAEVRPTKPLSFVQPRLAIVTQVGYPNPYVEPDDLILVEDFIHGVYEKFNSNGGWQNDEVAAVPAFSHYTYWKSDRTCLVCDIQGVRSTDGYELTDPAVHSRTQGSYGPTDLGPAGMTRFFKTHRCTSLCAHLPRPEFSGDRLLSPGRLGRRASSYTFMLDDSELEANRVYKFRRDLPDIAEV